MPVSQFLAQVRLKFGSIVAGLFLTPGIFYRGPNREITSIRRIWMSAWLENTCSEITGSDGEVFLRIVRDMYWDRSPGQILDEYEHSIVDRIIALGLYNKSSESLSAHGYLVGNVAKEYCNWIDHGRSMPGLSPSGELISDKDVLDVGCSYGRWLWEFQETARSVHGVELQSEYLELGKALASRENLTSVPTTCGGAEKIGEIFEPSSFDFIFSRLVFNHVKMDDALSAAAKVLRPGGIMWLEVERASNVPKAIRKSWKRPRSIAFHCFSVLNTFVVNATGRQLTIQAKGRMHSRHCVAFPSASRWKMMLAKHGFGKFELITDRPNLIFWGQKT